MMSQLPVMEIIMPQQPTGNVPAFLAKLWKMVDNPETDALIGWSEEGTSFLIRNQFEFTKQMLPYYYKHSNMASFVRQLNMYGFHKVLSVDSGGLKGENDESEFSHPYFMRGQEHLLDQIKRKVSAATQRPGVFLPSIKSEKVNEVLTEVSLIKDRQEDIDGKLDTMKNENEALWREVLSLRQKHTQQQKIVNKLIQFLVALVQPRMGGAMKRRYATVPGLQLAIEEGGGPLAKEPRVEEQQGPVIQEMEDQDISNMTGLQLQDFLTISQEATVTTPVELEPPARPSMASRSPGHQLKAAPAPQFKQELRTEDSSSQSKYRLVDPASVNPALIQQIVKAEAIKRPVLHREISKEDFDLDINTMQKELDNLKEILSGQITLDSTLVSSLFNVDDGIPNMNLFNEALLNQEEEAGVGGQAAGHSLVTYNPSLFELTEDGGMGAPSPGKLQTPSPAHGAVPWDPSWDPVEEGVRGKEERKRRREEEEEVERKRASMMENFAGANFDSMLNTPQISDDASDPLARLFGKK